MPVPIPIPDPRLEASCSKSTLVARHRHRIGCVLFWKQSRLLKPCANIELACFLAGGADFALPFR
jgi:hypothetical protein